MGDPILVARQFLSLVHQGDARRALWHSRRREWAPDPLPLEAIRSQAGPVAWVAATADEDGVHLGASDGGYALAPWDEVLAYADTPTTKGIK